MKKNRIIALLLAILMVVGTVPGAVFAQEDTDLCEVCQSEPCVCEGTGDESGEEPDETTPCEACGNDPCTCEGNGETTPCEACGNDPCTCESTGDEPGTESDEEAAPKCDCNPENGGTHVATCPNYVCPNCGGLGYHDVCPETGEPDTDSGEEPGETTPCEVCGNDPCTCEGTGETTPCEACGNDPCTCEGTDETTPCEICGNDPCTCEGTGEEPGETTPCEVCENDPCTCEESDKEPSCDFSGDVGKYAQFVEATDTYTVRNGVESSEDLVFYYSDFEDGTVLRITDWYLETETSGLWYQVEFYSGGVVEEYADLWPADPWILQDYLDENYEYDPSLEFVSITCDICGEEGCTKEHIQCEHCGQYDCTVQHTYCGGCGALDCPTVHIACPICQKLDCGVEHETPEQEDYTPPSTPTIPENPQLPEEYSVAITDEFGVPVTESGFDLGWNEKASLSAWSALGEDVSYQWQIFIDEGEGYWVDITGQTGKGLLFSRAMLMSALDDSGSTQLRCVTESDGEVQTSAPVQVTVASENGAAEDAALSPALFSFGRSRLYSMNKAATMSLSSVAPIDVGNEDIIVHTVTIDYVYGASSKFAGQRVALPYILEVEDGKLVEGVPITSPVCVGYETSAAQATIDLSTLGAINANQTITVEYNPAEVSYTVRHYLQNTDNDDYVWFTSTMATGKTEDLTSDTAAQTYVGFTALGHYREEIAADSSTTIDIYYDREYYLMSFDLDGGHGVDPIYARYGASISVKDPEKTGWLFDSWTNENGTSVTIPKTIPAKDSKYFATWKANPAGVKYTVAYWLEDANTDGKYNFWGSTQRTDKLAGDKVQGADYKDYTVYLDEATVNAMNTYEKRYSYYDHADGEVEISGDGSTVVNVYYKRNEYTLKFYYAARTGTENAYTYKIYGGSTYDFGQDQSNSTIYGDELLLLNNMYYNKSGQWGQVTAEPALNSEGTSRVNKAVYTKGVDSYNNVDYLYISFTAKYGEDISSAWPCNVFDAATRTSINTNTNGWTGTAAYVSAWNGEHHVYYSQHNTNETIKGNYNELDYQLLFDNCGTHNYTDSSTVAYLCFWENGSGSVSWNVPKLFRYNIYVPVLTGQDTTELTTTTYNGITYYLWATYDTCDNSSADEQTPPAINGYAYIENSKKGYAITNPDTSKYKEAYAVDFFYTRNQYKLRFENGGITVRESMVYFDADISALEPDVTYFDETKRNIYVFGGWYTSSDTVDGSEFELNGAKMPANPLTLYARWNLITYNVNIFPTEDDAKNGTNQIGSTIVVTHNEPVPENSHPDASTLKHPTDKTAEFIGWFYEDEDGVEQAFDFATMNIIQNMTVYAKWRSNVMKEVEISYIWVDGANKIQIADTETLMMRLGQTRTFEARTGNSLYSEYQSKYFPMTASHSITIEQVHIDSPAPVTYEFVYKYFGQVPYQVRFYVQELDGTKRPAHQVTAGGKVEFVTSEVFLGWSDAEQQAFINSNLAPTAGVDLTEGGQYIELHWENDKAAVVELYEPDVLAAAGWMLPDEYLPDALRIQKIIVPSDEGNADPQTNIAANIIEFVYAQTKVVDPDDPGSGSGGGGDTDPDPDVNAARYLVQHYIQSISDPNVYTVYRYYDESGTSGETATANPISIPGYSYSYGETYAKRNGTTLSFGEDNAEGTADDILSGVITTNDKLELNFYYTVNSYPYRVLYLEEGTGRLLAEVKTTDINGTLKAKYGEKVTENAIAIEGYDILGDTTKTIEIQMEVGDTASVNTIVFYYKLKSAELVISKKVELDPIQAAQEGITAIPSWVYDQEFVFTIYRPEGFPKIFYHYTFKNADGVTEERVVNAGTRTIEITLKHGESAQFDDFPMGTYTVTETYVPGFKAIVGGTIAQAHNATLENDDDVARLDFVNRFPFYTGDLVIKKDVIKLDEVNDPSATEPYRVTVVLTPDNSAREIDRVITWTNAGGTPGNFTIPKLTGSGDETTFTFEVLVPVDGEVKMEGVPVGSFTVTEIPHGTVGYITDYYKVTYNKALHQNDEVTGTNHVVEGVIHGGHPTAVTFHNTYKKGALTINKTVMLEYAKDKWTGDTFTFAITGTTELPDGVYKVAGAIVNVVGGIVTVKDADGNDPTITITKTEGESSWSGSLTFANLPAGYYTVTESAGLGIEKYKASGPIGSLLVNNTNTPTEANFTNEFKRQASDFTITRSGAASEDQVFVYRVTDEDDTLSIDVTIIGNNSVTIADLPLGNYKVEQLNDWSWRYIDEAKQVTHSSADGTTVTFDKGIATTKWLSSITVTAEELANFWKNIFGGT